MGVSAVSYSLADYSIELDREEDGTYVAAVPRLPGCMAAGTDPSDAVSRLERAFDVWVEDALDSGEEVPAPVDETEYGGRVLVRMPSGVHAELARMAEHEGVSMNQLAVAAISHWIGRKVELRAVERLEAQMTRVEEAMAVFSTQPIVPRDSLRQWSLARPVGGTRKRVVLEDERTYSCTSESIGNYDIPLMTCDPMSPICGVDTDA